MFKKENKSSFARQFLTQRPLIVTKIILLGIVSNLLTIMIPISIGRYYELVLGYSSKRLQFLKIIPDNLWNTPERFLIFFGVIIALRFIFFYAYQYKLRNESDAFIKNLKDYLFRHQLDISSSIYSEKGIGKYILRYTGDINSIKNLYKKGSIAITIDIAMLLIGIYALCSINKIGGLIIAGSILAGFIIVKFININLEKASIEKRNKTSNQVSFVTRILSSINSVKIYNRQSIEAKRYSKRSNNVLDASITYNRWNVLNDGIIHFIQYATLLLIFILFIRLKQNQNFTSASLISFILLFQTLIPALRRVYKIESVYKLGNISETKLRNIVELEKDDNLGIELVVNNPRLYITNFKVEGNKSIDFKSNKKEISYLELHTTENAYQFIDSIVKNKNTFLGDIYINKNNIKDIKTEALRSIVGISSTQYPLVGKTIYETLVKKRSDKTKEQIQEVFTTFKKLYLPESGLQLDDKIGENGSNITPIEIELISLIRGYINDYKESKFVIIDKFRLLEYENKDFHKKLPTLDKSIIVIKY